MSAPPEGSWSSLKRLCRYLVGMPRLVFHYGWQSSSGLDVYSDTGWGGCKLSRKSTSGGCILHGTHLLKSWSSTQPSVSLSSGEAEFYGVLKAAGAGLGMQSLMRDVGYVLSLRVWTDSSAAIGICGRQGLGKLRHIDTHTLWVQQAVRTKRFSLHKVLGEANPGDLFTKHLASRERLAALTRLLGCTFASGRAQIAPSVRQADSTKRTMVNDQPLNAADLCTWPCLPHLLPAAEREQHFPPTAVPDAIEAPDFQREEDDPILQRGLQIGHEAMDRAIVQGRLRNDGAAGALAEPDKETTDHGTAIVWADCPIEEPLDVEYWLARI